MSYFTEEGQYRFLRRLYQFIDAVVMNNVTIYEQVYRLS